MPSFVKGQSGNPKGRPRSYKGVQKLRDLIGAHAEKIVQRLILSAVNDGDVMAAKLLIERAVPAMKPVELPVTLPLSAGADLAEQGRQVIASMARGLIPPGQASAILAGIAGLAKLIELSEIESRIAALEAQKP